MPDTGENREWMSAALRGIGEAILTTDASGYIIWMNPAAETLTGFSFAEAHGHPLAEVLGLCDEATGLPIGLPPTMAMPAASFRLRRRSLPDCLVEVSSFCIALKPGITGAVVTCRDLTALLERENLRVRTERLDAIAGLAGGIGHDLNNYLTIIQGYTEELRSIEACDQTAVDEIAQASLAASSMTRNLMTLARRINSQPELLVLSDLVSDMSGAISRLLGKERTFRLIGDPARSQVHADPTLLKQVLTSIAIFARDSRPAGGEFCIESARADPHARLRISIAGPSLEATALSRIFEPLCTSRSVAFAHGIGLAQVYSMIAQCGGSIRAIAAPGTGLTFEILLPRVTQATAPEAAPAAPEAPCEDSQVTVLLVEDDPSVRRIVHTYVERAGFHLLEASNGEDAVRLAEGCPDPIHVLVSDVVLPGMSGRELAEKLRAGRPSLKVVLVSGFPRNTLVHTGAATGHRFLPKPFTAGQLIDCVRSLIREEAEPAHTV